MTTEPRQLHYIEPTRTASGPICRLLSEHDIQIAPSTYYAHAARQRVSQADWDDSHMANRLVDLWRANRSLYGGDKLHAATRRAGIYIGRDQVAR